MSRVAANRRTDQDPPPAWLAKVLSAADKRFPGSDLGRETVARLYPELRKLWQLGRGPLQAESSLYLCNGRIEVNPPIEPPPPVRPPQGAQAGQIFGKTDLRDPAAVTRLKSAQLRLKMRIDALRAKQSAKRIFKRPDQERQIGEQIAELQSELQEIDQALSQAKTTPPPSSARPRGSAACPPSQPACRLGFLGGACGLPAPLVLAAAQGAPIVREARYCLTSAFNLVPSHLAHRGFSPNSKYPAQVQERAYDRDKAEQYKVIGIAQNLVPELVFNGSPGAIDGLPVATKTGIVLGGNGRTMALQLHYAQGGKVARDYLLANARQFGFSKAQIAELPDPVVVRVIETSEPDAPGHQKELQRLVRLLNVPLTQSLDVRSESVAEARRLSDEALDVLSVALMEDVSLAEYLSSPASRPFAQALRRSEILTNANVVRFLSADGQIFTEDGKRFIERLLLASLVPDAQLLDRTDGRVRESLARSAPWFLSAAAGGAEWDLRRAIEAASRDLIDMRREGLSVDAFLRQTRMGEQAASLGVPLGVDVLRMLAELGTKPLQLSRAAQRFAELSRQHPSAQGSLLVEEKLSAAQALQKAQQA